MPHPPRFEDDDPLLAAVRERALALPQAAMKVSHGRPAFHTRKVFAYYGGTHRTDQGPVRQVEHPHALLLLLDADEREALLGEERCFVPAYLGPSGWLGVDLPAEPDRVDWTEVAELLDASYRRTAPAALVARLDDPR